MNEELQERQAQKTRGTSQSIATRRYMEKMYLPQCRIQSDIVIEYFADIWAPRTRMFQEEDQGPMFFLKVRLSGSRPMEMEDYVMHQEDIQEIMGSRADLSTFSADRIGCRIFITPKRECIEVLKPIIKASIRCG
jgi:hypothetical protein